MIKIAACGAVFLGWIQGMKKRCRLQHQNGPSDLPNWLQPTLQVPTIHKHSRTETGSWSPILSASRDHLDSWNGMLLQTIIQSRCSDIYAGWSDFCLIMLYPNKLSVADDRGYYFSYFFPVDLSTPPNQVIHRIGDVYGHGNLRIAPRK